MPKTTKRATDADIAQIRAALVARYKNAFGCEWELAPWGKPWADVLAEAQSADQEYVDAAARLTGLVAAIDGVTAYAKACGVDVDAPLYEDALNGRTRAEQFLLVLASGSTDEGKRLRQLRDEVAELTALLSAQPEAVFAAAPESAQERGRGVIQATLSNVTAGLDAGGPDWEAINHTRKLFVTHATRRMAPMRVVVPYSGGQLTQVTGDASLLPPGPPPRTLDGPEWRRAYLVQLLDAYPHRFDSGSKTMLPPSDSEIALISLLAGGLEDMKRLTPSKLAEGEQAVRSAERRAIAQSRKRRTFFSRRSDELGFGTLQEAARSYARLQNNGATAGAQSDARPGGAVPATKSPRRRPGA